MASNNSSDYLMSALRASGVGQNGSVADQLTSMTAQLERLRATNESLAQLMAAQQKAALAMQSCSVGSSGGVGAGLVEDKRLLVGGRGQQSMLDAYTCVFRRHG